MTTIPESFGADPVRTQWTIVRGDTSVFRVEFLEDDETTAFDTSTWEYESSVYDSLGDVVDTLEILSGDGYVEITATADVTSNWGTGFKKVIAELPFDLQVTIDGDLVWTPVIGTIKVLGDVTGGSL